MVFRDTKPVEIITHQWGGNDRTKRYQSWNARSSIHNRFA